MKISEKSITFNHEFKELFIDEYLAGKLPKQIFEDAGFDIDMLGRKRIENATEYWRAAYEKKGALGLQDAQKTSIKRTLTRVYTSGNN